MMDKLLEKVLKSNVGDLKITIKNYIKDLTCEKYEFFEDDLYLFFKLRGSSNKHPIMLSCHMDTVHRELPAKIFKNDTEMGNIIYAKEGIGGDDRAGVYALLKIVERFVKFSDELPKYLLFTDKEEIGYEGAKKFVEDFRNKEKIGWIVELDAANDKIEFYDDTKKRALMTYFDLNFSKNSRVYPCDMTTLCEGFKALGVNVGVGYCNQHKKEEYINLDMLKYQIIKIALVLIRHIRFSDRIINLLKKHCESDN